MLTLAFLLLVSLHGLPAFAQDSPSPPQLESLHRAHSGQRLSRATEPLQILAPRCLMPISGGPWSNLTLLALRFSFRFIPGDEGRVKGTQRDAQNFLALVPCKSRTRLPPLRLRFSQEAGTEVHPLPLWCFSPGKVRLLATGWRSSLIALTELGSLGRDRLGPQTGSGTSSSPLSHHTIQIGSPSSLREGWVWVWVQVRLLC